MVRRVGLGWVGMMIYSWIKLSMELLWVTMHGHNKKPWTRKRSAFSEDLITMTSVAPGHCTDAAIDERG